MYEDSSAEERVKLSQTKRLDIILNAIERLMKRQGRILPIEVAKKVDIKQESRFDLSAFMRLTRNSENGIQISRPEIKTIEITGEEETIDGHFTDG